MNPGTQMSMLYMRYTMPSSRISQKASEDYGPILALGNLIPSLLIEVKPNDPKEAEVRLITAASTFLNYLQYLLEERAFQSDMDPEVKTLLKQTLPPALSWLVQNHEWKFYVCYRNDDGHFVSVSIVLNSQHRSCMMTDIVARCGFRVPRAMGTTSLGEGAIRVVHIIETVKMVTGEQYLAWLMEVFGLKC